MSIRTQEQFDKLRAIGRIVRAALDRTAAAVRPGITTAELDAIGARVLAEHGAESAPPKVYGFPGALCISVNDEAIHGIPGGRVIRAGDLVKLDLVAEKDGYFADAAVTVTVGAAGETAHELVRCAESAFCWPRSGDRRQSRVSISDARSSETRRCGFQVMRDSAATAWAGPSTKRRASPITTTALPPASPKASSSRSSRSSRPAAARASWTDDRWTIHTADRSLSAHYEHPIVITRARSDSADGGLSWNPLIAKLRSCAH